MARVKDQTYTRNISFKPMDFLSLSWPCFHKHCHSLRSAIYVLSFFMLVIPVQISCEPVVDKGIVRVLSEEGQGRIVGDNKVVSDWLTNEDRPHHRPIRAVGDHIKIDPDILRQALERNGLFDPIQESQGDEKEGENPDLTEITDEENKNGDGESNAKVNTQECVCNEHLTPGKEDNINNMENEQRRQLSSSGDEAMNEEDDSDEEVSRDRELTTTAQGKPTKKKKVPTATLR